MYGRCKTTDLLDCDLGQSNGQKPADGDRSISAPSPGEAVSVVGLNCSWTVLS